MKTFSDILSLYSKLEPDLVPEILIYIERLYYAKKRNWWRPWRRLDGVKVAYDVMLIEKQLLQSRTLPVDKLKSKRMKNNHTLNEYAQKSQLDTAAVDLIRARVISPARSIVAAVLLTEVMLQEQRKDRFRWLVATLLGLLIGVLGIIAKLLGDINVS